MAEHKTYTKDDLGDGLWGWYKKRTKTMARPVEGPFRVVTREGSLELGNEWRGWLAVDAHGYPYPIDAQEFDAIYEVARNE